MGSNEAASEKPVHAVQVDSFEMDVTEVTVDAYGACVKAGRCTQPNPRTDCNWGVNGKGNHPINCVDWNQAKAYCEYVGKRLPTEEEWEYAARGTDGRTYPWGNGPPTTHACWKRQFGARSEGTCAVGSHPSGDSRSKLHDMAGNVCEWTSSGYSSDYANARSNRTKVHRGASWIDMYASDLRAASRRDASPGDSFTNVGVRCAR